MMGLWVTDRRHVNGLSVTDVWDQTSDDRAVGH